MTARLPSASRRAGLAPTATCQAMRSLAFAVGEVMPEITHVVTFVSSHRLQTTSTTTVGRLAIG